MADPACPPVNAVRYSAAFVEELPLVTVPQVAKIVASQAAEVFGRWPATGVEAEEAWAAAPRRSNPAAIAPLAVR